MLLLLLLVGVVGFAGYRVWKSKNAPKQSSNQQDNSAQSANQSTEAETLEYSDDNPAFSIRYPKDWLITGPEESVIVGQYVTGKISFTSPGGAVLKVEYDLGGRGGACEPEADDVPHAAGNACGTWELLSKDAVDIDPSNTGYIDIEGVAQTSIFTTRSTVASTSEYSICLDNNSFNTDQTVGQPYMGAIIFPCGEIMTNPYYFRVVATSADSGFLDSNDAVAVKKAIKTFRLKNLPENVLSQNL